MLQKNEKDSWIQILPQKSQQTQQIVYGFEREISREKIRLFLLAAQNYTIRANYFKAKIEKYQNIFMSLIILDFSSLFIL